LPACEVCRTLAAQVTDPVVVRTPAQESALRRCDRGEGLAGSEVEHVHDRAPDVFLPGEHDQVIAYRAAS
jgi:hypothetical protein